MNIAKSRDLKPLKSRPEKRKMKIIFSLIGLLNMNYQQYSLGEMVEESLISPYRKLDLVSSG